MTRNLLGMLSLVCWLTAVIPASQAAEPSAVLADETALKAVGLPTDGPGLVEFFRARVQTEIAPEKIAGLIKQLNAPVLTDREKACAELIAIGPPALPELRRAAKDIDDVDTSALARRCLTALEGHSANLTGAAARLLAVRHPTGAVETLLTFLPCAENASVLEEVKMALMTIAYRDNTPDPVLVKALEDELPLRRATAIEVLGQTGSAEPRTTLRKLLHDPVPIVRLQAGLVLMQANDGEAIATMISLLTELPAPMAQEVEDSLTMLAGEQGPKPVPGNDAAAREKRREAWKAWWEANDGTAALAEFRKRTLSEADHLKGAKLIATLADDDFDTREKASEQLRVMGTNMLPLLRAALRNPDLEVRRRVQACLDAIKDDKTTPLPLTAPRLLAVRKPAGATEAMLAFLPLAEDESTQNEIQAALNALAYVDGKPDAALVKALDHKTTLRRVAAAVALAQAPTAEVLPALRNMLKDPDAAVRLPVAVALANAREREAVPVLIALIGELPPEQSEPAEEYLQRLAADHSPTMPTGEGDLRKKRREAWETWWDTQGAKIEMVARVPQPFALRFLNYTILVHSQNGAVEERGADGKTRWQITGLLNPMDAHVLPGERVLIAEYTGRRVTERNVKGDILWQKQLTTWPLSAQRLPNGNTFIVARNLLVEVDRAGKEVFTYNRNFNDIMSAAKTRNGQIIFLTSQNSCIRIGADGKELKTFPVNQVASYGNEVLPNGHVLVAALYQNKVLEYDAEGKIVWEATVTQPWSATRLANGNTLVAIQQFPWKVVELDRQGKQVSELGTQTYIQRARKR